MPGSASEKQLIDRLTRAYETGDVDGIIALFTDDAWLTMPPAPLEYQGRDLIAQFLAAISFRDGRTGSSPPGPTASSPSAPTCAQPGPTPRKQTVCWYSASPAAPSRR